MPVRQKLLLTSAIAAALLVAGQTLETTDRSQKLVRAPGLDVATATAPSNTIVPAAERTGATAADYTAAANTIATTADATVTATVATPSGAREIDDGATRSLRDTDTAKSPLRK